MRKDTMGNDVSNKPQTIDYEAAVALLPDGDDVHTFRSGAFSLVGADWKREKILALLKVADEIHVTGGMAQGMGHGMAVQDDYGWLFIATRKEPADG